jgi:hypothetical protein
MEARGGTKGAWTLIRPLWRTCTGRLEFLRRPSHNAHDNWLAICERTPVSFHFETIMTDHSQSDNGNPYSPLKCILLLLTTGMAVKIGAAVQLCHLSQSSCQLGW